MAIARFFDKSIIVRRLKVTSGKKRGFSSTATVDGHLQEMDSRSRQEIGIVESKALEAWFPEDVDIKEGDELIDPNNVRYTVIEKVVKDYGINRHSQIIMTEKNA